LLGVQEHLREIEFDHKRLQTGISVYKYLGTESGMQISTPLHRQKTTNRFIDNDIKKTVLTIKKIKTQ
jgi:hypothetical protein